MAKPLQPVEIKILDKIAEGKSNKVIGKELAMNPRNVQAKVHDILNKLGADNRAQAVALYLRPEGTR